MKKRFLFAILVSTCISLVYAGDKTEESFTNSIGMKLLRIEPGTFVMGVDSTPLPDELVTVQGSPRPRLKNGDYDEVPRHKVTITKPFYISETEVTIEQFKKFKPDFPGFKARLDYHPYVSGISWYDAVAFCKWLSEKEGISYRLPTEAEWEYACRAGTQSPFSSGYTRPEHETANLWGLKNMHTGVLEWCLDWHGLYPETSQTDPVGPEYGWVKVVRGGGLDILDAQTMGFYFGRDYEPWAAGKSPFYARSANRAAVPPSFAPPPREYQAKQMEGINPPLPSGPQSRSSYRAKGLVGGWHYTGFRVVQGTPSAMPNEFEPPFFQRCVKQSGVGVIQGPDMSKPYYRTRPLFPSLTKEQMVTVGWQIGLTPGLGTNQHNGAVIALDNGDLLACYYNGFVESDPDLSILVVRLRYGSNHWDIPSVWPDFLDGNDASPFIWNDDGTIWLGWGCPHLTGGYPFQWTVSKDNGASWSPIKFPIFESRPGGYGRRQPINSAFRGPDDTIYVAFDGWGATCGLWASKNNGNFSQPLKNSAGVPRTWFDTGGRTLGLHSTFVLLDDNSILAYATRNRSIDGFCPRNISTDWGKTWQVSRSPVPAQGGGQNPVMIKLVSGRLLYVSDFHRARDPNVTGFTGGGAYVCLSEDRGQTWRIRKLFGGQTRDEGGKPIEVRTAGYVGACQSQNGVIHLVTSHNQPDLHIELNEAWILQDGEAATAARFNEPISVIPGTVKEHREDYRSGKPKAIWSAGVGEDGRYLLDGKETWFYETGQKQWEINYQAGCKIGTETYWNKDGTKKWQWDHRKDRTSVWTVWGADGKLKAKSHWRGKNLLGIPKPIISHFGVPLTTPNSVAEKVDIEAGSRPEYLKAVIDYADTLIAHGRDTYGSVKSPVFIAGGLDLKSNEFVRRQLKGQGIREGDRAYGANPHHDLNFYQLLYALTKLTGDKKYARQADKALKWFFENCQSPATGLFAWGEHLHWDVTAEQCKGRDIHEFYRPWVLWPKSFELAPRACEAFATGLWDHQVYNHSGDFNRHAKWSEHGPGQHCNISRHAGFCIATWAEAFKRTKNPVFLKAIERVLIFKEASRHPITGALPSDRAALSVQQWFHYISGQEIKFEHDPRIGGLHSHVAGTLSLAIDLEQAAKFVPAELARMMLDFAHTEDEHFLKYHEGLGEDSPHLFVDLAGVSTMKAFVVGRSYCPIWDFEYGKATEAQVALVCYERYKQLPPGKVRAGFERLIKACAQRYLNSNPPPEAIQKPGVIGDVVLLMTAAYQLTGDKKFLDRADEFTDIGIKAFLDISPLPRVAVGFEHYEAITRADTMMMGLLKLWQIHNKPEIELRLIYTDR